MCVNIVNQSSALQWHKSLIAPVGFNELIVELD